MSEFNPDELDVLISLHDSAGDELPQSDAAAVQQHIVSFIRHNMTPDAWEYFCENSEVLP
jgi:hypothetical protein